MDNTKVKSSVSITSAMEIILMVMAKISDTTTDGHLSVVVNQSIKERPSCMAMNKHQRLEQLLTQSILNLPKKILL